MARHQLAAIGLYLAVAATVLLRDGSSNDSDAKLLGLGVVLILLLAYRWVAWLAGFGLAQRLASDYGREQPPAAYAVLLWIAFLLGCLGIVFGG